MHGLEIRKVVLLTWITRIAVAIMLLLADVSAAATSKRPAALGRPDGKRHASRRPPRPRRSLVEYR